MVRNADNNKHHRNCDVKGESVVPPVEQYIGPVSIPCPSMIRDHHILCDVK